MVLLRRVSLFLLCQAVPPSYCFQGEPVWNQCVVELEYHQNCSLRASRSSYRYMISQTFQEMRGTSDVPTTFFSHPNNYGKIPTKKVKTLRKRN